MSQEWCSCLAVEKIGHLRINKSKMGIHCIDKRIVVDMYDCVDNGTQ